MAAMKHPSSKRFWQVLLAVSLGIVALMFWWLESGFTPETPAEGRGEAERSVARPAAGTETLSGAAQGASPVVAVEQARSLKLTPEQAQRVADWIRQLEAAADAAARDEVLEDARSHEETEVLVELVLHQLAHVGTEERIDALQKLVGSRGASQIKAFVRGLEDTDQEVREASLQLVRDQETEVRVPVFEQGLSSSDAAIRSGSLLELTRENVKLAIPALMRALALEDSGLREQAANELRVRLSDTRQEPFVNAAEALRWWEIHGRRYDERMYRVD